MHWAASTNWRDYVALVVLLIMAPCVWIVLRKLWRSIPDHQPERKHREKPTAKNNEYRIVTIATYMNDLQADTACATLKSAGIPAFSQRDDCAGMRP